MNTRETRSEEPFADAPRGHVVVGVDGSQAADRALDEAVEEARRREVPLEIVHGWPWQDQAGAGTGTARWGELPTYYVPTLEDAETVLAAAVARVRATAPDLTVTTTPVAEEAAAALVRRGRDAALTVVGTRGLGGFAGLLLGSVSLRTAAHAHGPLLVVRGDVDPARKALGNGTVLLGVESDDDVDAAAFAFEEAARRDATLSVLHAWTYRQLAPVGLAPVPTDRMQEALAQRSRAEAAVPGQVVAELREKYPQVRVRTDAVRGGPAHTLMEATRSAGIVVIAAHRRRGRMGLQLGPVTHALLHHAHCPVALIPVEPAEEAGSTED